MRTQIEKIHSAARRYCIERSYYWHKQYYELIKSDSRHAEGAYSNEPLNLFPRYNCIDAILVELEKFTPEDFTSFSEAKDLIIMAGNTSESIFTSTQSSVDKQAMLQERDDFSEYIKNINEKHLENIEPLFYRRVLTESESRKLWAVLQNKWDIQPKSYWYPLKDSTIHNVIAFQEEQFDLRFGVEKIRQILLGRDINSVWTLTEYGPEYQIDLSEFEPLYYHTGVESYSFSQLADWVIYASHEGAITFGGDWLISEVQANWPEWESFVWHSNFENE